MIYGYLRSHPLPVLPIIVLFFLLSSCFCLRLIFQLQVPLKSRNSGEPGSCLSLPGLGNQSNVEALLISIGFGAYYATVDDINPALPKTRNIPLFPWFRVSRVMQDLCHHQQYSFNQEP